MPVSVKGDGYVSTLQKAVGQQEVALGALLLLEEAADHRILIFGIPRLHQGLFVPSILYLLLICHFLAIL